MAKAEASYMPAPGMVRLCKPAQRRKASFNGSPLEVTMKLAQWKERLPMCPQGNTGKRRVTGGADPTAIPTSQSV